MTDDPRHCHECGQYTAYFDKVAGTWRCPCGWIERRARFCPLGNALLAALSCLVLFGPERIPMDEAGGQWEYRARLCTIANEPHVLFEDREYLRLQAGDGSYRYRTLTEPAEYPAAQEAWWRERHRVRLYVTTTPIPGSPAPPSVPGE